MSNYYQSYQYAKERYAELGVDTDAAIETAHNTPISLHCWQGDDVLGFESENNTLTGGIQTTGNYPGRARSIEELRQDFSKVLSLIPGTWKLNLHANYLDCQGQAVDRNELQPEHFASWIEYAKANRIGLDFNSTFFSHKWSENGSLTNPDPAIRNFWIQHAKQVRKISESFGAALGIPCVTNHWIPDGQKEIPVSTMAPRERLIDSLDQIFAAASPAQLNKDSVESKLFGIGSEGYVPGSLEFYLAYTMKHPDILLTLDAGHFHPTEVISAKISSILCFKKELLLHVSRPVRWDSDHVVLFDDETRQIMQEIVRNQVLDRVYLATDYFDASINRLAAWTIGARNTRKALLYALLEPVHKLKALEQDGDCSSILALTQEALSLPWGAVWDYYCESQNIPGQEWIQEVKTYERTILQTRSN